MALRLPTLDDILERWETIREELNPIQMQAVVDYLRGVVQKAGLDSDVPEDPVTLALKFSRYAWMDAPHLHYLSKAVSDAVAVHENLLIITPPRHAKSHLCSVWTPFWALAKDPMLAVLLISYEARFARRWGARVRTLVDLYGEDVGLRLNPKQSPADDWETTAGGGMQTSGAGGPIPGKPAKLLILDDVIKEDDARSPVICEKMWDWWETTVVARMEPDTTTIVIGTCWSEDDLLARLIKHSDEGSGVKFRTIRLSAIAEESDPLDRLEGEGLWLTHREFTQEWYERKRDSVSPHVWTTVYQGRPTPKEGTLVDPSWWTYYKPSQLPPMLDQEIQSWDLALDSVRKSHSFHVGIVAARDRGTILVRDRFRDHCGILKVRQAVEQFGHLYPRARAKIIERKASGPAFIQAWQRDIPGLIPWPPEGRRLGSKEARLDAVIPYIRSGNVRLPINEDGTKPKWVQELIEEYRQFPRGTHDDQIDALNQAVLYLLPSAWQSADEERRWAEQSKPLLDPVAAHSEALHGLLHERAREQQRALEPVRMLTPERVRAMATGGSRPLPFSKRPTGLRRAW